jgi:hypothetical protein
VKWIQDIIDFFKNLFRKKPKEPEEPDTGELPSVEEPVPDEEPGMITEASKQTIFSILSIYETGTINPDYGSASLIVAADGTWDHAGITYGKHQSTDHSDSLDAIVYTYIDRGGQYASQLRPYLDELDANASVNIDPNNPPQWVEDLMALLRLAGNDPIMHKTQDDVFEERYWQPAVRRCLDMQLARPLSWCVVYDTCIHSGPSGVESMRRKFAEVPPSSGGDEFAWTIAYLNARREWLLSSSRETTRKSVYRVDSMLHLAHTDEWELDTPLDVPLLNKTITIP